MYSPLRRRKSLTAVYQQVLEEDRRRREWRAESPPTASPPASSTPIQTHTDLDDNVPSLDESLHIEDVTPRTPTREAPTHADAASQTPRGPELHAVVLALREAVKHRELDARSEDDALRAALAPASMHALVHHRPDMELSIEKLSADDAHFAERLNQIRVRLGALAGAYTAPRKSAAATAAAAPETPRTPPRRMRRTRARRVSPRAFAAPLVMLALVAALMLCFHVARAAAERVRATTFYDPFHPALYPLSPLVQRLLPPDVVYDVPFASTTDLDAVGVALAQ